MKFNWPLLVFVLLLGTGTVVRADDVDTLGKLIGQRSDSPSVALVKNENILRLTPDRTHIVRLEQDAASVIVANPMHAVVMLDSPRLLVVMPRQPGATTFTVLNSAGNVILEQDVVISGAQQHYVRVRRMCDANDRSCTPNSYFYCPDGCYEVSTVPGDTAPPEVPEVTGGAAPQQATGPIMPSAQSIQTPQPEEEDTQEEAEEEQNDEPAEQAPEEAPAAEGSEPERGGNE